MSFSVNAVIVQRSKQLLCSALTEFQRRNSSHAVSGEQDQSSSAQVAFPVQCFLLNTNPIPTPKQLACSAHWTSTYLVPRQLICLTALQTNAVTVPKQFLCSALWTVSVQCILFTDTVSMHSCLACNGQRHSSRPKQLLCSAIWPKIEFKSPNTSYAVPTEHRRSSSAHTT